MSNTIYPVITLYQPWASWIMWGWKTIETRTHNRFASLEGKTILIHAGKVYDTHALPNEYIDRPQTIYAYDFRPYPTGAILGYATVDHVQALIDKHSEAALIDCGSTLRYGLFLSNIVPFEKPIAAKGGMGIWYFDLETEQKVKKP